MAVLRKDGHYGIENKEVGRTNAAARFLLALGYLVEDPTVAHFVIHVKPMGGYLSDLTSERFLELLGFRRFTGQCPWLGSPCFYRYVFEDPVRRDDRHARDMKVRHAHKSFKALAECLNDIYEQVHAIYTRLGHIPDLFQGLRDFGPAAMPDFSEDAPWWLEPARTEQHREARALLAELLEKDKHFRTIEYVLWGTGDELEESVQYLMEDIGFEVARTPKGATVDRLVTLPDTDLRFGFEITGLNDAIKKKSNKITQALSFVQQRESNEKPVILANTFNDRPLEERSELVHFTDDALEIMQPLGIVGATTVSLYEIWKAISYGGTDVRAVAEEIHQHPGGEYTFAANATAAP